MLLTNAYFPDIDWLKTGISSFLDPDNNTTMSAGSNYRKEYVILCSLVEMQTEKEISLHME